MRVGGHCDDSGVALRMREYDLIARPGHAKGHLDPFREDDRRTGRDLLPRYPPLPRLKVQRRVGRVVSTAGGVALLVAEDPALHRARRRVLAHELDPVARISVRMHLAEDDGAFRAD